MPRINQHKIHVLIANASEACSYLTMRLGKPMQLLKAYNHPESREKGSNLVSDRAGNYQTSSACHYGALAEPTSPKEVEAERFAHLLAEDLNHMLNNHQYDALVIIAPPHFHGLLNKYCHLRVRNSVIFNIEKDYTKLAEKELLSHLTELPRPFMLVA